MFTTEGYLAYSHPKANYKVSYREPLVPLSYINTSKAHINYEDSHSTLKWSSCVTYKDMIISATAQSLDLVIGCER